jgi:hypothetical protein
MSHLTVVKIDRAKQIDRTREELLEVIDALRELIAAGEVVEFVSTAVHTTGDMEIYSVVNNVATGIGLYEIGKQLFIDDHL